MRDFYASLASVIPLLMLSLIVEARLGDLVASDFRGEGG